MGHLWGIDEDKWGITGRYSENWTQATFNKNYFRFGDVMTSSILVGNGNTYIYSDG